MFKLTSIPLEKIKLSQGLRTDEAGAFASFEGIVRNHQNGQAVSFLEYEAQEALCNAEAKKILEEANDAFNIINVRAYHRSGRLEIGEMAVWVGVTAAHRDEAFKACRYIIDEIKKRLPIWKKEFYADGSSNWVEGNTPDTVADRGAACRARTEEISEQEYYARQINLPEVGEAGQKRLKEAKVLVVGAGGLGCPALMSLAGAGVGTIGICEHDKVELTNLHRQFLYTFDDIGRHKIEVARDKIAALNPSVTVREHHKKLNVDNAEEIIEDYDVILDCTDNITAKYVLNDACYLAQKTLIQVGIYQWEGQLRVMLGGQKGCLRCLWPQVPQPGCVGTCVDGGVLGVIPNVFGHLQAMEALRIILKMQHVFENELLMFNIADFQLRRLKIKPDDNCPLCGSEPSIDDLDQKQYQPQADFLIDPRSLTLEEFRKYILVDVREMQERRMDPLEEFDSEFMPLSEFTEENIPLDKDKSYLLFCSAGIRSSNLAAMMREMGYPHVYSASHGIEAIRQLAHKPAH